MSADKRECRPQFKTVFKLIRLDFHEQFKQGFQLLFFFFIIIKNSQIAEGMYIALILLQYLIQQFTSPLGLSDVEISERQVIIGRPKLWIIDNDRFQQFYSGCKIPRLHKAS